MSIAQAGGGAGIRARALEEAAAKAITEASGSSSPTTLGLPRWTMPQLPTIDFDAIGDRLDSFSDRIGRGAQAGIDQVNSFVRWTTIAVASIAVIFVVIALAYVARGLK